MLPGKLSLYLIAIGVVLPSTMVAAFFSLLGAGFASDALRRHEHALAGLVALAALVAGWFGLVTLWRLHYRLLHARLDFNRPAAWAGLACGSVVVLALVLSSGGTLVFRVSFFGWPLLAAAYYAVVLWRLPTRAAGERQHDMNGPKDWRLR
ncbi:hypothetical protein CS053_00250 [Rhodanobacter glycinis]|uniref:Uncharacterized protein n=1 Tax=Rhodanobacter glycinis TaxID=582702 RepID=A0A5B9DYL1_9GAMM|nr:hypothetical protein [Rhodanobacter glycinis]QEE23097.1 hypothetical protein CS053_00250 [Rhodanobacter glycinis]